MTKLLRAFPIVLVLGALLTLNTFAQNPAKDWQNEDLTKDSVYGTSSDKALEFLKGKPSTTVVVAVIDGGVYINHPALKEHIWVNPKEIPGNHIDDDKNGYVDDVNGWDFIGGKGRDVKQDNFEITRLYMDLGKRFAKADPNKIADADKADYKEYLKVKKNFEDKFKDLEKQDNDMKAFSDNIIKIKTALGDSDLTKDNVEKYNPSDSTLIKAKERLIKDFDKGFTFDGIEKSVKGTISSDDASLTYQYNISFNPRSIVGDNYADATERYYGNNDVVGPTDTHATHVSGIIAGNRTGKAGEQEGIADNVKIMVVRVVPDGDERDKDVANGIRYAVDNGAKVVNMSFGKQYAYNKKTVDDAVKYAEAHDVLLVHAAGNERKDNDTTDQFPNPIYADNHKKATNWLEVGASDVHGEPAPFSNYGKKSVDLFAPGVKIYSSVPDSGYAYFSGTSMASPCAAGVAAIIREYFPTLTAMQVKKILMKSVTKITFKVPLPGHPEKMVKYTDLCVSGGVINAYKAVQLAMKMAK